MKNLKKHKIEIVICWITVVMLFTAASCIKDTGNYNYHDVNSITISGINTIEESYKVSMGQPLRITPTLTFSVSEDKDSLQYAWHVLGGAYYTSQGVLSTERNLDIVIAGRFFPRDATFQLMYCVTNMTTGIRYDHRFRVTVEDRMQTGYIMLCERENDSFDIELISVFNDTLTQYHHVLDAFDSQLPRTDRKPIDLICYRDGASPTLAADGKKKFAIWILTDQETERVRIEDFEWQPEFNISGISAIPDKYLQNKKFMAEKMHSPGRVGSGNVNNRPINWAYFEGNWYWYNAVQSYYFYLQPINAETSISDPYKAAPYVCGAETASAILFNEDENRFEWQNTNGFLNSSETLHTQRLGNGFYFNWENADYRLIYMDNRTYATGYAIVKNEASGKYELLMFGLTATPPSQLAKYEFPNGFPVEDMKFFAFAGSMLYLYCATEDNIYRLTVSSMAETQLWNNVTTTVLPAGHKFSKVKSSAIRFPRNTQLVVCTYDPNGLPGQNGQLAFYDIQDGTGNLTLAKHPETPTEAGYQIDMKWSGFGKIINVDYKQPDI